MVSPLRKHSEVNSNESYCNQQISSSLSSCSNSNNNNEYIWILIELVEYIMQQQQTKPNDDIKIPHQWKPTQQSRKRSRSSEQHLGTLSPKKGFNDSSHCQNSSNNHHYWGWCRAIVLQQQQRSSSSSSSLKTPVTNMSIQINDSEFAPASYQNRILQFSYDTHDDKNSTVQQQLYIHRCNDWWLVANERQQFSHEKSPPKLPSILKSSPHRRHSRSSNHNRTTGSTPKLADTVPASTPLPEPPNDLTMLEQLHEPAVLYCLYRRFRSLCDESPPQIYTYTGKILIAMNPFVAIPSLYGDTIMELYYKNTNDNNCTTISSDWRIHKNTNSHDDSKSSAGLSSPPPHIYAIAQNAYSSILVSQQQQQHQSTANNHQIQNNQCILVSGESGAGKTVTTKIVLQYLARLSQQRQHQQLSSSIAATQPPTKPVTPLSPRANRRRQLMTSDTPVTPSNGAVTTGDSSAGRHIELQILESNPILESFGNARTIRNDNSSRFGKYIELSFDVNNGTIVSATIQTYLLEKVRLISQSYNERNYHIFYEILSPPLAGGLSPKERQVLHVTGKSVHDFHMTCISQTYDRRDNVKDRDTYRELRQALDVVGFTRQEQLDLFTVVCALLYISNVTFVVPTNDDTGNSSMLDVSNPSLRYALELLGVDLTTFNNAMCTCTIEARNEILIKHLSIDRAVKAVEAFIKTTYSALFNYIVKKINSFITVQAPSENEVGYQSFTKTTSSIGVLDIFGFESFDRNSFEQLCINYCNEALQQQFNKFVFKNEQQEYEREDIDWSFISFPDNQDVLDLIEKRHDGILSILDEQCRLPRCTDTTFANALYQKCGNSTNYPRLHISKAMQAQYAFAIHHYAGLVEYDTEGFIEKNQDELPKSTTELLQSSSNLFFATLGRELSQQSGDSNGSFGQQQSPVQVSYANRSKTPPFHRSGSNSLIRESVGTQFSSQLKTLRTRIESTSPHYVRCIKPNDDLLPNYFDANVIADQLRCAGVFEAIRVSRVGFPHRYFHDHFMQRYGLLERHALQGQQKQRWNAAMSVHPKEQCVALVSLISSKLIPALTPDERKTSEQSQDGYVVATFQMVNQPYIRINLTHD
jgi:myosin V